MFFASYTQGFKSGGFGTFSLVNSAGAITTNFEVSWDDERGGGWAGLNETMIDAAAIVALRVGFESDSNWYVEAYVENLFDEFKWDGQNNNLAILPSHLFGPQRPRTVGLRLGRSRESHKAGCTILAWGS